MAKVTFPPLIALLQDNAEALNLILRSTCAVSRQINTGDIPGWFTAVIEPVFKAVHEHDQTRSRKLFDVLYRDMLTVLSSPVTGVEFELSKACRLLIGFNPAVTAVNPARILALLASALQRICKYSHQIANAWIALMQQIVPLVENINELLAAGRIAAWRCGMANLRARVDITAIVDQRIIAIIFADENGPADNLKRRWDCDKATASLAAGGFVGLGGSFARPPCVALHDDLVFVSDKLRTNALFADRFGCILQECTADFSNSLTFTLKPLASAPPRVAQILARYPDLSSWVHHDATLYVTTRSSHSVFLFGAIDG